MLRLQIAFINTFFYGSQYDLRCLIIAVLVEGFILTVMGKADVRKDKVNMQAFKKV